MYKPNNHLTPVNQSTYSVSQFNRTGRTTHLTLLAFLPPVIINFFNYKRHIFNKSLLCITRKNISALITELYSITSTKREALQLIKKRSVCLYAVLST